MPAIPWPWPSSQSAPDDSGKSELQLRGTLESLIPTNHEQTVLALSAFALGSVTTLTLAVVHRRYFRRLRTGDWITPDVFAKKRWIRGIVTSVGDADNFRLYHTPGFWWKWPLKLRRPPSAAKELKDQTLHIRLAGVDAPEAAHFGKPAQPFSAESLAWLKSQVEGKTVYCQLLRRDQYSRVVAVVMSSPRIFPGFMTSGKSLSLEMLRAGWATTYEQSNAEYGPWGKEEFLRVEQEAKDKRRGMWKNGTDGETPAEYKRRHAAAANSGATTASSTKAGDLNGTAQTSTKGWFSRFWNR